MASIKSSYHYTEYLDSPPRCMPYRIVNKKSPLKSQNIKDIDISFLEKDNLSIGQYHVAKILTFSDMDSSDLNIRVDKKTVRDAVLVKHINLKKKQVSELRRNLRKNITLNRRSFNLKNTEPNDPKQSEELLKWSCKKSKKQTPILKFDQVAKTPKESKQNILITQTKSFAYFSKSDMFIHTKLVNYLTTVKQSRKLHKLDEKLQQTPKKKAITIFIRKGNNSHLVKELIKRRWWLTLEQEREKSVPNFIWSQLKEKDYFLKKSLGRIEGEVYLHNHFAQNEYMGNKKALLYSMSHYYQRLKKNVFNYLPLTFHIHKMNDEAWKKFQWTFFDNEKNGFKNIWIVKPGENSNRGKGITIHNKIEEIQKIVSQENQNRTFIIQTYISKPFLYHKRKFDFRCYMLLVNINKSVKGYWYKEGYIRTSSYEFQLNDFSNFVHLTNDAIQNCFENYGKYEDGNKISYTQFQKYLDSKYPEKSYNIYNDVLPQMKNVALDSIKACLHLIKGPQSNELPVFEIFGLDFMIDQNFKPWLIQINTNPCIETCSSVVMSKIIPKMLDQAFKLSLDVVFPPPQIWPNSKKHHVSSSSHGFQLIFNEQKEEQQAFTIPSYQSVGLISQDDETFEEK